MKPRAVLRHIHILNFGAGVQSTTLALLAGEGRILGPDGQPVRFDCAIFADTQEEPTDPGHSVPEHLAWMQGQVGFPILVGTAGKLGDHLARGRNSTGGRFASIPAFTLKPNGKVSKVRRQCTKEYKIEVIEKVIRRQVLGLKPRQWIKHREVRIHHYIGISLDEVGRMVKAQKRQADKPVRWAEFHYPLIHQFQWTRGDCRAYLAPRVPHRVPRSACVFCPFHDNNEWQAIKDRNGADWARAVQIDRSLRVPGNVVNRGMNAPMFLHRCCRPLDEIDFKSPNIPNDRSMAGECEGMCGH